MVFRYLKKFQFFEREYIHMVYIFVQNFGWKYILFRATEKSPILSRILLFLCNLKYNVFLNEI